VPSCLVRPAFTLTEILIVIALIVLMLALAVPAFNIIRGSRSTDSAQNQIAAMIGHARADAIGLQKIHGVMFFIDPATNRVNAAEVTEADYPDPATNPSRDVYLDLVPDTDFLPLPQGVLAFTLGNGTAGASDRYVGYNTATPVGTTSLQYGGVILFDAFGQLTSRTYGFRTEVPGATAGSRVATPMQFLITNNYANHSNPASETGLGTGMQFVDPGQATSSYAPPLTPPTSALGFVLCDEQSFKTAGSLGDPLFTGASYGGSSGPEAGEESWLDNNSSQLIINRYNGTLTRAD
jgi:prepilin-type N-terminal cleavage/methylation domain-containing protein